MAHIALNSRVSFDRLVDMVKEYQNLSNTSKDVFEKAEYEGFLSDIFYWVSSHRGLQYWYRVRNNAMGIKNVYNV